MTATMIRRSLALALVAATGCGGNTEKPAASGCVRSAILTTGPGDVSNYFPAGVGATWNFTIDAGGGAVSRSVTGTQPVGSETAAIFSSSTSASTTVELVVKRPGGVYVLADASVDPLLAEIYPSLVLPFPVAVMPPALQASCTNLDVGDADGDGKPDQADMTSTLRVFSISETATIAAGNFIDVAHVQTDVTMTVRATAAGSLTVQGTQDDWYAPGVGLVSSRMVLTIPGYGSDSQAMSLASYAIPTPAMAPAGAPASSVSPVARAHLALPGGQAHRASVEEAVLEAARHLGR
jgi:hypothetical protein